jgi:hypothetical protein
MARTKKAGERNDELVSFRVSGDIKRKLDLNASELNISPSQFARNIIIKYYENTDARPFVSETGHDYKISPQEIQLNLNQYFNSEQGKEHIKRIVIKKRTIKSGDTPWPSINTS